MTQEDIMNMMSIIRASMEGKTVEYYDGKQWNVIKMDKVFAIDPNDLRIKAEAVYEPFDTDEEAWNEMMKHQPFGWLTNKANNRKYLITALTNGYASVNSFPGMPFDSYFNEFTFVDGSPFGMKKKEA